MMFHGNSFKKRHVIDTVDSLNVLPEAKVHLRNALLEYGSAYRVYTKWEYGFRAHLIPKDMLASNQKKAKERLDVAATNAQENISNLSFEQQHNLLKSAKEVKHSANEKINSVPHEVAAIFGSVLIGTAAYVVGFLITHNPGTAMLASYVAGVSFGILVLLHWIKKEIEYEKAKALFSSVKDIIDDARYSKKLNEADSPLDRVDIHLDSITFNLNKFLNGLKETLDSLPF